MLRSWLYPSRGSPSVIEASPQSESVYRRFTTRRQVDGPHTCGECLVPSKKKQEKNVAEGPASLLKQLAAQPHKLFSNSFRQQYAALCFRYVGDTRDIEILVMTSRDTGRWVIPKGWPMKNKPPHEAAATEAWEEAGVKGKVLPFPVGRYTYLKLLESGDVAPTVVDVYQVEVLSRADKFKEKGQRIIRWMTPEEAARKVREIELKSLLVDFTPSPSDKLP